MGELIDPITGQWDEALVQDLFWRIDAQCILSIPLQDEFEDDWAWHYDSSGVFSVKTAYKMIRQMQQMTSTR